MPARSSTVGKSLLPFLEGRAPFVHAPEETIGFEGTGGQALFKGGYKLMRNGAPFDDMSWHLYAAGDWTESADLAASRPELVRQMEADMQRYFDANGVVMPEAGYSPLAQLLRNNAGILLRQLGGILAGLLLVVLGVPVALFLLWRRRRGRRAALS
jgi:arylsulfatase/uncharacterized sulfatase